MCTAQQLYKIYKEICLAQASEPVSEISFKRCVNSVYKISPVKTRNNNSDIIVCTKVLNMSNRIVIHRHPPPLTVEMMKCASTELPMGWFFVSKANDTEIVGHRADVCFDDIQIMKEVHLTSDGTGTLYAGKKSVDPANIGLPINLNVCHLFMIFNVSPNAMYA